MLDAFWDYLKETDTEIKDYFTSSPVPHLIKPPHLHQGVMSYLLRPAKRLRPAVMKLACGCLGGGNLIPDILPLAAGLELFHTWTLVHDDIIDNDDLRRGEQTVHVLGRDLGGAELNLSEPVAEEYGRSLAILAGDIQHGWVNAAFLEAALDRGIDANLIVALLHHLETEVITRLIYGELLDVQFSLRQDVSFADIGEEEIIEMEWLKTGNLYEFAARCGAMIGRGTTDFDDPAVTALAGFAANCGIAFQLQDDVLGITGDQRQLGKPIGSDIREGKKTVIVLAALRNAAEGDRERLLGILGNRSASENDVNAAARILEDNGGVEYTRSLADGYIEQGIEALKTVPESEYRDLLQSWAEFMVNRDL